MIRNADSGKPNIGAVLVVGGGIGGIQAALDLADSGQKVYLVESDPSIGGHMARLDKTFPTNDCSMCILSPKLVEAGRHLNIDLLTYCEVESVIGSAGHFTARIRHKPRYVDPEACTGCGDCEEVCPVSLPNEYEEGQTARKAIFRPYAQGVPNVYTIQKAGEPPCQHACPADVPVQGFVALIRQKKYAEALEIVRDKIAFPAVCGRVCVRFCETHCTRGQVEQPVDIMHLKRFICDWEREHAEEVQIAPAEVTFPEQKVAVIGAGPAGLQAAADLARAGHPVTVFEELAEPGGMMRYGIPDYRLPKDQLDFEIDCIRRLGVEIRTHQAVGRESKLAELRKEFAGVLLAVGAHVGSKLRLDGEDTTEGVLDAVEFLRNLASGKSDTTGRRVVVVGGGNAAIDAARTSVRLGKDVTVVYRRTQAEMPADAHEVHDAIEEGVEFLFLANPCAIHAADGKLVKITCQKMKLGPADDSGRRRPVPIEGETFDLDCDALIPAIGQKPGLDWLGEELATTRWGTLDVDDETLETSMPGVFAAGDAVTGPASVIEAIAAGRHAADNLAHHLAEEPTHARAVSPLRVAHPDMTGRKEKEAARQIIPTLPMDRRTDSFEEVELGYSEADALAEADRCMQCGICSNCGACVRACQARAVDHSQTATFSDIEVGSVILAPGGRLYEKQACFDLGGNRLPDVVTSMEFERILSASGPTGGHVVRPSDHKVPEKVAFLQCVGSRDLSCRDGYCSSVCCMYAVKEAVIAHEHEKRVQPTVFLMDLRAYGKDFDKYCLRAKREYGVRFVRSRVSNVERDEASGQLVLTFATADGVQHESFDMVVLSVGFQAPPEVRALCRTLGIRVNEFGFVATDPDVPMETSRKGVFAIGVAEGPKDIPETVVQASAAACQSGRLLAESTGTLTRQAEYPPEKDLSAEPPRIGVFVCHCGINIGGIVDVPSVAEYVKALPNVVHAEDNLYTCSQDTQVHIRDMIVEHDLNRVVVASCTPRTHEPLFQQTLREAGLNPNLFVMANIRDQCSWAHMNEPEAATEKARDLLRMIVAKARHLQALHPERVAVQQQGAVLGGGVAGMHAALAIADRGYPVHLIEREDRLGGNLRHVPRGFEGQDYRQKLAEWEQALRNHPNVTVHTATSVTDVHGFVGNFTLQLSDGTELPCGAVVVATGAKPYEPAEDEYAASHERVITQVDLLARLQETEPFDEAPSRVVMIQCVGSRSDEHPWCSRICCTRAVQNAVSLKERCPETDVTVLYRDIRTYGLAEQHYQRARELGVTFIRFEDDQLPDVVRGTDVPSVSNGLPLAVSVTSDLLGGSVRLPADWVVLSTGVQPDVPANDAMGKLLKVPVNDDGFFLEAHVKLRPVEFATDGVFVCGLAHNPKNAGESVAQALAAAGRACTVLEKSEIETQGTIAECSPEKCATCGLCESICPYSAITMEKVRLGRDEKQCAQVNPAVCKGCGACVAACRSGALDLRGFTNQQILAEILQL
jgi:heterodisulfide reductase subunit A-like polyferredoxin